MGPKLPIEDMDTLDAAAVSLRKVSAAAKALHVVPKPVAVVGDVDDVLGPDIVYDEGDVIPRLARISGYSREQDK